MDGKDAVIQSLLRAQSDPKAADALIEQYLPFIKAEVSRFLSSSVHGGEDELSIAMFAFYEALISYSPKKGSFFSLAKTAIRNRLIDNVRKEKVEEISLQETLPGSEDMTLEETLESKENEIEKFHSRTVAQEEIAEFTEVLEEYGLTLSDIASSTPKQDRTLLSCMHVLEYALKNTTIFDQLILTKKLPLTAILEGCKVEKKTLERHRKYIVAILLAYTNGFEIIRGHLNLMKKEVVL